MSVPLKSVQATDASYTSTISSSAPRRRLLSHLPILRYTTLSIIIVALDSLLSISLWIVGGNSQYLENSVEHFSLYRSTFDLAVIAALRGLVLIGCLYYVEYYTLASVSTDSEPARIVNRRLAWFCHGIIIIVSFATMVYAATKLTLVLLSMDLFRALHITYKVLFVVGVASPALELILGGLSFYFMWRLVNVQRLRLILQNGNGSSDAATDPSKKADIKRLVVLAIPVSTLILSVI